MIDIKNLTIAVREDYGKLRYGTCCYINNEVALFGLHSVPTSIPNSYTSYTYKHCTALRIRYL